MDLIIMNPEQKGFAHLSANEYQVLVEQAPIMIWRSDTTKSCNYFNETWLKFTGKKLEEELGNGWTEGVHPDDFERCLDIYITAFDKKEIFEMEYRLRRYDGSYRWILDRGVPYYDDNNQFGGFIGSCIDIHDGKLAQEKIDLLKAEKIHQLQELIPICAWCRKVKHEKNYWSDVEVYLTKLSGSEITHVICQQCREKAFVAID